MTNFILIKFRIIDKCCYIESNFIKKISLTLINRETMYTIIENPWYNNPSLSAVELVKLKTCIFCSYYRTT